MPEAEAVVILHEEVAAVLSYYSAACTGYFCRRAVVVVPGRECFVQIAELSTPTKQK